MSIKTCARRALNVYPPYHKSTVSVVWPDHPDFVIWVIKEVSSLRCVLCPRRPSLISKAISCLGFSMVFSCHIRPVVVCWSVVGYGDCFRVIVPCKQQVVRDGVKNFAESIRKAFTDGFRKVLLKGVEGTPSWLPNQMISFSIPRWPRNIAQQCARVPPKFVHLFLREIKIRHQRLGVSPNLQKKVPMIVFLGWKAAFVVNFVSSKIPQQRF